MAYLGHAARLAIATAMVVGGWGSVAAQAGPSRSAPQGPGSGLRSPYVNLRLGTDLGDAMPEVRAALLGLGAVRIAEPADYELTTKRDFPQTLIAIDVTQPTSEWQNDFSQSPPVRRPRTIELGNLTLDDYLPLLRDLVGREARANSLLAGDRKSEPQAIETCLADQRVMVMPPPGNRGKPHPAEYCHQGPATEATPEVDGEQNFLTVKLRNRSNRPRYVAVLLVSPASNIALIPFQAGKGAGPLAPGAEAETEDWVSAAGENGNYVLVTISSDRPIDVAGFLHSDRGDDLWWNCMQSAARDLCARPAASTSPDWSISLAEYPYRGPRLVGVGGGEPTMAGMAPWMAEIYSTVPYTRKDFADDAAKPADKSEHLAELNAGQLNHRCGGTLIAANYVLTAAHCVAKDHYAGDGMALVMKERRVRIGSRLLGKGGTTYAIAGVAVPATYVAGRQQDDIALLMLKPDRDTEFNSDSIAKLGDKPIAPGTAVTAYGWGYTGSVAAGKNPLFSIAEELQHYPDMLRFGRMEALAWSACRRRLGQKLEQKLGAGMVCLVAPGAAAGETPDKNVFSCRGDSGGPLTREIGESEELVGVTSWSMGCGYKDFPSVYTDVTKYRRWIAAAMQQLKPGAALRVDERAAPSEEGRRQQAQ